MKKIISIILSFTFIFSTMLNVRAIETDENAQNENSYTQESSVETTDDIENVNENNQTENEIDNNVKKDETNPIDDSKEPMIEPKIMYRTHMQDYGWNNYINEGVSGVIGRSKRLEAIKIKLDLGSYEGSIAYATHIQDIGWSGYVLDDQLSGTIGKSKRVEAIKIKLVGKIAEFYDVYYRVYVQNNGWLDWTCNGASAGSETYGKRLEGIEIKLIKKGDATPSNTQNPFLYPGRIYYSTHVQDYGWLSSVGDGELSGTTGKSKRVEALKVALCNLPYSGNVEYSTHVQDYGWQAYQKDGNISGTTKKSKQVEAIKIRLTGEIGQYYDVYYRVYVKDLGWMSWACNDAKAGSEGFALRIEAIQICLIEKNGNAPGDTARPFIELGKVEYSGHVQNIGWQNYVNNGATGGTTGKSLRLEALRIKLGDNVFSGNIEYSTHVQDYGWLDYVSNDAVSGTIGKSKRVEAIKIRLTGEISQYYDVFYRVHCQDIGWMGWTANDRVAGTTGGSYKVEAIQIKLYPKNMQNPGISNKAAINFKNNNGYYVCYDANGKLYEDAQSLLGTKNTYVLRVNKATNVVTVLVANGAGTYNIAYKRFVCSTGKDTPSGTYYTPAKYRWKLLMGPSYGQYSTRIVGGILFHSVPYNKQNPYTLSAKAFNQLGTTCSHGCVRLMCKDAKWIYDNCALGTRVDIVSGKDPLSKPTAPKIPTSQTWDPTDPNI